MPPQALERTRQKPISGCCQAGFFVLNAFAVGESWAPLCVEEGDGDGERQPEERAYGEQREDAVDKQAAPVQSRPHSGSLRAYRDGPPRELLKAGGELSQVQRTVIQNGEGARSRVPRHPTDAGLGGEAAHKDRPLSGLCL
jgi:hypothetical protein